MCVRPVRESFVRLFVVSHSTSKITDEELRRGGVICKAVRWKEGSEKAIFSKKKNLKKILLPKIFSKKYFHQQYFQKINSPKIFAKYFS